MNAKTLKPVDISSLGEETIPVEVLARLVEAGEVDLLKQAEFLPPRLGEEGFGMCRVKKGYKTYSYAK